jgi:hypothetical protein
MRKLASGMALWQAVAATWVVALGMAACSGETALSPTSQHASPTPTPSATPSASATPTCPPPAPIPFMPVYLVYPIDGSTGVSPDIGQVVAQGYFAAWQYYYPGPQLLGVTTKAGTPAASATIGPAPSPLPTPTGTAPPLSPGAPYGAITVPSLSPMTTYEVSFTHNDYDGSNPPTCVGPQTDRIGSFMTR